MWFEFALIGMAAGYLAGFLGVGGGLVMVPAMTFLFLHDTASSGVTADVAIHTAIATSLATMLVTSVSSLSAHHRKGAVQWPLVRMMTPGLVVGGVLGAILASRLSGEMLQKVFAIFSVLAGLQLMLARQPTGHKPMSGPRTTSIVSVAIGAISSLVGIGGGSLTVPWLLWHRVRAQVAVGTSAACGFPIAVAGAMSYVFLGRMTGETTSITGYVHLPAFLGIAITSALVAPLGVATVHRLRPELVRRVFGAFMFAVGLKMLFD